MPPECVIIDRLAAYEDIGKTPEEIRETLDKDNRLISEYAEENDRLKRELEKAKAEMRDIRNTADKLHKAISELNVLVNL